MRATRLCNPALPLALGLAAAGCARDRAQAPPVSAGPRSGGVIRIVHEAPASLDPLYSESVYESLPVNQLFDGLVALGPSLNPLPALAETWTVTDHGTMYEFHLRGGVRFHDGSRLTAADVAYSLHRILEPSRAERSLAFPYLLAIRGARGYAAGTNPSVPGIHVLDDQTLRVQLERPYPAFLEALALDGAYVVPHRVVEALGEAQFGRQPVGTGPFRLAALDARGLRLEAHVEHFRGRPWLDAVEVRFPGHGDEEGVERFRRGEIDVLEVPAGQLEQMNRLPGASIRRFPELYLSFLGLNTLLPPLDQPEVRRAIAHALRRDEIAALEPRLRRPATGILPPGMAGYSPEPVALPHDPEAARRELAQAGHPGGRGLPAIELYSASESSGSRALLSIIVEDLAAVGLTVQVRHVRWPELNAAIEARRAPAFLLGWLADLPDPDSVLRALFAADGSDNYFGYCDERADRLLASAAAELNPVDRARVYRELERHVLAQAPIVPLFHGQGAIVVRQGLEGLHPGPLGLAVAELEKVWIDE